jgi:hypothetical protein
MDVIFLFWFGWTAGYLHSCHKKGKYPSWLYGVGSFWFFSIVWGDGMLWGSAICLLFWILFWIPRMWKWLVTLRWHGGDDDDDGQDPRWLSEGDQGGGVSLRRVIREDDPWANPEPVTPIGRPVHLSSPSVLPRYPGTVPNYTL